MQLYHYVSESISHALPHPLPTSDEIDRRAVKSACIRIQVAKSNLAQTAEQNPAKCRTLEPQRIRKRDSRDPRTIGG